MTAEFKGTQGPWRWELHEKGKQLNLTGTGDFGNYDNIVMDFERWGMQSAQPRFNNAGFLESSINFSFVVKDREHHQSWFKGINHPDANLIAAAPDLLEACIRLVNDVTIGSENYEAYNLARAAIKKALNL